jgi:hypothetical protein
MLKKEPLGIKEPGLSGFKKKKSLILRLSLYSGCDTQSLKWPPGKK